MKKLLLFTIAAMLGLTTYAQNAANLKHTSDFSGVSTTTREVFSPEKLAAKGTAISDTLIPLSQAQYDSVITASLLYYLSGDAVYDSGFIFGMNPLGLTAFADWWRGVYGVDTTVRVLGFRSVFGGTVVTNNKNITVKVWKNDTTHQQRTTHTFFRDFPSSAAPYGSMTLAMNNLGIGVGSAPDTIKNWYFPTPITGIADNFHLGYEMAYTWGSTNGDTIGVHSTRVGSGWGSGFYQMQGLDSVFFAQTTVKSPTGWVDIIEYGINKVNISIIPLIQFQSTVGVHGLANSGFTFYGNYPNPAVNNTNIRFAIDRNSDVNIELSDLTGRVIRNISERNMSAGEHTINMDVSDLAAGNYIYTIYTKAGSPIACQFSVVK